MSLAYVKSLSSLLKSPFSGPLEPALVNIQSPLYRPKYFGELIRGMARRHRPDFAQSIAPANARVQYSELDQKNWHRFVAHRAEQLQAPLTYYNSAGAFCLFKILADLQINFSTILHLRASIELTSPLEAVEPDSVYYLTMRLIEVIPRKSQCILVMRSELSDKQGTVLRVHKDYWFVKKCPPALLQALSPEQELLADEFRGLSKTQAQWPSWNPATLIKRSRTLHPRAGQHYGYISGDHNVIHTTHWGARMCGQKRPFLQGFGLMNLALHEATQARGKAPQKLSVTFARPALVGQELTFFFGSSQFEICDEQGKLLAFGLYN